MLRRRIEGSNPCVCAGYLTVMVVRRHSRGTTLPGANAGRKHNEKLTSRAEHALPERSPRSIKASIIPAVSGTAICEPDAHALVCCPTWQCCGSVARFAANTPRSSSPCWSRKPEYPATFAERRSTWRRRFNSTLIKETAESCARIGALLVTKAAEQAGIPVSGRALDREPKAW